MSSLDKYTHDQLTGFLESDNPPPAQLTRKQIREAMDKPNAEKAKQDKDTALKEAAEKTEQDNIDVRNKIFLEERDCIDKYSSITCRSNNIYFRLPSQEH